MVGVVNVVKCCCRDARPRRGGALALVAAGAAVVLVVGLYRLLAGALAGVRESTHAANLVVAWLVGGGFALALVLAGLAVLVGRRRQVRDAPVQAAFTADVDRALDEQRRRPALNPARPGPQRIEATRLDALDGER